jgi:hypothetical protein
VLVSPGRRGSIMNRSEKEGATTAVRNTVVVNDRMHQSYTYDLTEPEGENFHPDFKPDLTPEEMLRMGVFGGKYMTDPEPITRILTHIGEPTSPPLLHPARGPPQTELDQSWGA